MTPGIFLQLLRGLGVSLLIFFLTLIFSIPIAAGLAIFRIKRIPILSRLVGFFIDVMRGTPLMLQLLFFYFGPYYILRVTFNRFASTIFTFSLNYAAYFAEIFRSGYISIPVGQHEACKTLGFRPWFSFSRIYVPQIIKRIIPSFSGEVISLVKDTALASTLSIMEMFAMAQKMAAAKFSVMPIIASGIFYFIFNSIVAAVFSVVERRLSKYVI